MSRHSHPMTFDTIICDPHREHCPQDGRPACRGLMHWLYDAVPALQMSSLWFEDSFDEVDFPDGITLEARCEFVRRSLYGIGRRNLCTLSLASPIPLSGSKRCLSLGFILREVADLLERSIPLWQRFEKHEDQDYPDERRIMRGLPQFVRVFRQVHRMLEENEG